MKYEVRWTETSLRQLEKMAKDVAKRVIDKLESVSKDPFRFAKKLKGFDLYTARIGDYRVIFSIQRKKMLVFVLEIGHRSVVYRKY